MEKTWRKPRRLFRTKARVFFICPTYIDYMTIALHSDSKNRHGFCFIDKLDYEPSAWDQIIGLLEESVRWNTPMELIIERRQKKDQEQWTNYLIDVHSV